jgi:hypothetical protein
MPCTKDQLIAAINSFASARTTGDVPLMQMAADVLTKLVDTLEFSEPEPEEAKETES